MQELLKTEWSTESSFSTRWLSWLSRTAWPVRHLLWIRAIKLARLSMISFLSLWQSMHLSSLLDQSLTSQFQPEPAAKEKAVISILHNYVLSQLNKNNLQMNLRIQIWKKEKWQSFSPNQWLFLRFYHPYRKVGKIHLEQVNLSMEVGKRQTSKI